MADGTITIDTALDSDGLKKGLSKIGGIAKTGFKTAGLAIGAVAGAFTGLVATSVKARGKMEQTLGGIETLFKDNADSVIANSKRAYETAGISANDYMQQVTSFSASLLQSVGGDTEKAANIADMAIRDMSDNANKMGTNIADIQNAYQGFAKQNYTMLDNLKLGYGGTKTEMERLLADAEKFSGIKYDINSLSDVYEAIHVVQQEMGITGTTALEAKDTLEGSFSAMKASWENFMSGAGDLTPVVENAKNVVNNILGILSEAVPHIVTAIVETMPQLLGLASEVILAFANAIVENLPILMESVCQIIPTIIQGIITLIPQLIPVVIQVIQALAFGILENLPLILEAACEIIPQILLGIAQMMPELIPKIADCIVLMCNTMIENLDLLIDATIVLMFAIIEGIVKAYPDIIAKMPEMLVKMAMSLVENADKLVQAIGECLGQLLGAIIKGAINISLEWINLIKTYIIDPIANKVSEFLNIGKNIVEGLWNGIKNAKDWLFGKIKSFVDGIVKKVKDGLGIHSPSKVFADEIGKFLPQGIGVGFDKELSNTFDNMQKHIDIETSKMSAKVESDSTYRIATQDARSLNSTINLKNTLNVDGRKLSENNKVYNDRHKLQYGY